MTQLPPDYNPGPPKLIDYPALYEDFVEQSRRTDAELKRSATARLAFNPDPPCRADHPTTSHEAAERIKPVTPTIRAKVWGLLNLYGPMTDREILYIYRHRYDERCLEGTIRCRRIELVQEGRVESTGEKRNRMTIWKSK